MTQENVVACGRRGCGALYHRRCWNESLVGRGGCTIEACVSRRAEELSAAAWGARRARLAVAATLFRPALVRLVRRHGADWTAGRLVGGYEETFKRMLRLLTQQGLLLIRGRNGLPSAFGFVLFFLAWIVFLAIFNVFYVLVAISFTLPFFLARAAMLPFADEVSALARVDDGEEGVVTPVRRSTS